MSPFHYVLIFTILMLVFFALLYRWIMKDTKKEPTNTTIKYDYFDDERRRFDDDYIQYPELTNEAKKEMYNDVFENGEVEEHSILAHFDEVSKVKNRMKDVDCNFLG